MRVPGILVLSAFTVFATAGAAHAQQAAPDPKDPRVGLKGGLHDAGVASKNMELVSANPKPEGFFDPAAPAGAPIAPERPAGAPPENRSPDTPPPPPPPGSGFTNSDLAFKGNHAFVGNYHGFNTYDIENTRRPRLVASVICPGGQGDVSIHGNLLFMSVEQTRGRLDCGLQGIQETVSKERFRGIRIFDISDMSKPKQVAAVQTCRGSHTHTLVTTTRDRSRLYIYGSGTSSVRPGEELAGCSAKDAKEDPGTSLFSIDVIEVPLNAPQNAKIVNQPRIFADDSGNIAGLWKGGTHGEGTQTTRLTNQCHDITVFPDVGLAAGACAGNGILLDVSDPVNPKRLDAVIDPNFAYWHSATFNNDGTKVLFTDEWGGGSRPRCRATDKPNWGANAIFDIVDGKKMVFKGYYKMPAAQTEQENCVAHNGSLIPVPGRDIMVQAWYQGGLSVFDFTNSTTPVEIAYFDRGPVDEKQLISGGYWSVYWYNGNIYGAEIARGLDVFRLTPSEHLTQNEIDAAMLVRHEEFNPQQQPRITWPAAPVVARAYLDQLSRSKAIQPERARAITAALDKDDVVLLESVAGQVEAEAKNATGRDAQRLRDLASTLRGRAARLK